MPDNATTCRHCGAVFARSSKSPARQLGISGGFAMACGGLMILLALALFIYGGTDLLIQAILVVLGLLLIYLGKKIR